MTKFETSSVGVALITSSSVLGFIAILTTCLRVTVRISRRVFGKDDVFMIAATVTTIVRYSINSHAVNAGYGRHQDELNEDEYTYTNFLSWLGQIFLFTALCLMKISIGLLIMRIKDSRKSNIFQWTLIGGLALTNLEVLIVLFAECRPMSAYWNPSTGICWSNKYRIYSIYIQVGFSILTDVIYSLMPAALVWRLTMKLNKKLGICALMCMGLCATICAVLRARSLGLKTNDLSWDYAIAAIWGNVELGLGTIAANMVLLRSYITFFTARSILSSRATTARTHANTYSLTRTGWTRQHRGIDLAAELDSTVEDDEDSQYGLTTGGQAVQVTQEKSGSY